MFCISLQLDTHCTSAVEPHYAKMKFTFHESPDFKHIGVHGSKSTCHWL